MDAITMRIYYVRATSTERVYISLLLSNPFSHRYACRVVVCGMVAIHFCRICAEDYCQHLDSQAVGYIIQFEPIRLLESHSNPKLIYRSHPVFSIKNVVQPTKKTICIGGIRSVEGFASFTNEFIPYGASLTDFSKNLCKTMLKVIYVCI